MLEYATPERNLIVIMQLINTAFANQRFRLSTNVTIFYHVQDIYFQLDNGINIDALQIITVRINYST